MPLHGVDQPSTGATLAANDKSDTLFLRSYANLLAGAVDRIRVIEEVRDGEARLRTILEDRVS